MTLSPQVQELLDRLAPGGDPLDFAALMQALYELRYNGPLSFDFHNGIPRQINLGPPVRLTICQGEARPKRHRA